MVIQSLINHNFIEPPQDFDILSDYSSPSKKLIALEIVETLTVRYLDALCTEESIPAGNAKTNKLNSSLPVVMEPFPDVGNSLWKLPTWQHVTWTTHALSPIFGLGLDSLNSISNAVKIYCLWLKNPAARPSGVNETNLEQFISLILFDISELFETRKGNESKNSLLLKRHMELCQQVIRTIVIDLIPNCHLFKDKATSLWKLVVGIILGITDNLLWNDKSNYLADELSDMLLNSLFYVFILSELFVDDLWKKFHNCFKSWCHRMKTVLCWGNVVVAVTEQIANKLVDPHETIEVHFGLHHDEHVVECSFEYAKYTWIRLTNLLPKPSTLTGEIFLRALQATEKLINIWIGPQMAAPNPSADRKLPGANTIFEIYGDLLFDAANVEKQTHEQGRAIASIILCRLLSKWQYRENISEIYLSISCKCLKSALLGDLYAAAAVIMNIEPIFISGHVGLLGLIFPLIVSIRRFIPRSKTLKIPSNIGQPEAFRMHCYRLLNLSLVFFSDSKTPITFKADLLASMKSLDNSYSVSIFQAYSRALNNPFITAKAHLLDTVISSLLLDESPNNTRFLLNSVSSVLFSDYSDFPEILQILVKMFEELLCNPPPSWKTSKSALVDTQIAIGRILEQWSRIGTLPKKHVERLCFALINFSSQLHEKANLPLYFRLIISLYEPIFSWIYTSGSPLEIITLFISSLVKFVNDPLSNSKPRKVPANTATSAAPLSPSIYGIKYRKSLTERVFTLELGNEDQRPESLSPTLLKGIDEIFMEYTDSMIQKLISVLLQEQINFNYPVKLDSDIVEYDSLDVVKYYAISSSILVGFTDKVMIVRTAIGKFTWSHDFKVCNDTCDNASDIGPSDSSVLIDQDHLTNDQLKCFERTPAISDVIEALPLDPDEDLFLNDSIWKYSLYTDQEIAIKLESILVEAEKHLSSEIIPNIPQKARLNRVRPLPSKSHKESDLISRLFFTHFGYLNSSTFAVTNPIQPVDSGSFVNDLRRIDEMTCREMINIPVHFIPSNYYLSNSLTVSESFAVFVKCLGSFTNNRLGPIFSDSSMEVNFPVILPKHEASFNESVSIIWSEDCEDVLESPPASPSNFAFILVSPALVSGFKGKCFRIRILLARSLQAEYESIKTLHSAFGPLLDGTIVGQNCLSRTVRETAIFAHKFIAHFVENSPNPIMRRQTALKSLIFKNYHPNTYGSLLNSLL